ncbi:MAG TPA: Crp/Fnr family transcriptional regulator [Caldilineaceae bacterium]|nr:Crp/Fnr family transcriptional regulator [Caldilineaceae bacterium]
MQERNTARRLELLKAIPLFGSLREAQLLQLVNDFRLREFEKDEIIFRQGDESREVYIVLKGMVRIYKISPGGGETSIDLFSTHDLLGEMAALDYQPRSATAKAISPVSLLTMSQENFLRHLHAMPELTLALARLLSQKLRWTASFAESVAQFDAAGRLLHFILLYNARYGKELEPGRRYELDLALNQSDLASMVGARREWVNRIMADWRRRGLLEFDRGVITILDLPRVVAERDSRTEANLGAGDW